MPLTMGNWGKCQIRGRDGRWLAKSSLRIRTKASLLLASSPPLCTTGYMGLSDSLAIYQLMDLGASYLTLFTLGALAHKMGKTIGSLRKLKLYNLSQPVGLVFFFISVLWGQGPDEDPLSLSPDKVARNKRMKVNPAIFFFFFYLPCLGLNPGPWAWKASILSFSYVLNLKVSYFIEQ